MSGRNALYDPPQPRASARRGRDGGRRAAAVRAAVRSALDSPAVTTLTILVTLWALFGDDLRVILATATQDGAY